MTARFQGVLSGRASAASFLTASSPVPPAAFLFVLGLYILLLTSILMSCAVEIEVGDDRLAKRMIVAQSLPVAMGVFTAGALIGGQFISALIG
ncbi:MAG: hypothetical protein QMC89_05895 [Candidatus Hodarchaeaceae archaeon]|nr:hypothetical protein [Candidatus Hodarchaeaceae archaeon]